MKHTSIMASLASAFQIPVRRAGATTTTTMATTKTIGSVSQRPLVSAATSTGLGGALRQQSSGFSSTTALGKRGRGGGGRPKVDRRVAMIRYALSAPLRLLPPPLRLSRLRALRHWTIHRAWQLHQRSRRTLADHELARQWESMRSACEELRTGAGDGGRLFRQAMAKKGYFGGRSNVGEDGGIKQGMESGDKRRVEKGREGGVPIEYARGLVDFPAREGAWDHGWTRG